MVDFWLLFFIW